MSDLLDAALYYADLGYPVFPCAPGRKTPITPNGFKDATTDPDIIRAWWTETPDANIGMPTEGLLVVDIDGADNPWLTRDPDLAMDLARGPVQQTPRGGRHYLYRQPAGKVFKNTAGKLAHKVDTRASGGYILIAPSRVDGKFYGWLPGSELDCELAVLPEPPGWLIEVLEADPSAPATPHGPLKGNAIPPGQRNDTLARIAGSIRRMGLGYSEIAAAVQRTNAERCHPPLPEKEVSRIVSSICRYEPDQVTVAVVEDWAGANRAPSTELPSVEDLVTSNPHLHPAIIHGLLREGEIMNIIAPPKFGKSWLVNDLALSICTGRPWLDTFAVEQGDVLIIDNELHAATSANRIPRVAEARGILPVDYQKRLFVANLRGQLQDLIRMRPFFDRIQPGRFKLIILDAFYRFLPPKTDENDNGSTTMLYNQLDYHAGRLRCGFTLIHHTSKGQQGEKALTDVGAGAGAQARATDTHLVMRKHKQEGAVVLEAAVRSWPAVDPLAIRFDFPIWNVARDLDPAELEGKMGAREEAPKLTPEEFLVRFYPDPEAVVALATTILAASQIGLPERQVRIHIDAAVASGELHKRDVGDRKVAYSRTHEPAQETPRQEPDKRALVLEMVRQQPGLSSREIGDLVGLSKRQVNRIRGLADDPEDGPEGLEKATDA